jgi:hypothetical protein
MKPPISLPELYHNQRAATTVTNRSTAAGITGAQGPLPDGRGTEHIDFPPELC